MISCFCWIFPERGRGVKQKSETGRPGTSVKGPLQGLEGELVRLMGHKRVVIRLEGVVSIATSYIPGSFLERIE